MRLLAIISVAVMALLSGNGGSEPVLSSPGLAATPQSSLSADPSGMQQPAPGHAPPQEKGVWAPPDVDADTPPVDASATCQLPDVLQGAGARLKELVTGLEQFAATEHIEHTEVSKNGGTVRRKEGSFNYVVSLREVRPGLLSTEEFRNGLEGPQFLSRELASSGLPFLVLIFHPDFAPDFEMACLGLGQAQGEPAWVVHFRQRPERPSRLFRVRDARGSRPVGLRGRAWISAHNSQILRLETDIVAPVKEVELFRSHKIIEYGPVHFEKQKTDLWLPRNAEVYLGVRGRYYQIRHSFGDYMLFGVAVKQQIAEPH